jgi:Zn-dependent oligopeptidase
MTLPLGFQHSLECFPSKSQGPAYKLFCNFILVSLFTSLITLNAPISHLENAVQTSKIQYSVELAETEVALTAAVGEDKSLKTIHDLLYKLDQIEAPICQITEVGRLFTELASSPDQHPQWQEAYEKARSFRNSLQPYTQSKIIYRALMKMATESTREDFPLQLRLAFEKEGISLADEDDDKKQQLEEIQKELKALEQELEKVTRSRETSKAARLQTVKCMYNIIGLSHLQAQQLNYPTVSSMAMAAHHNMATSEEVLEMQDRVSQFLKPHLPEVKVTLDDDTGAFLPSGKAKGPTESEKELWMAKQSVKKLLNLDGVLQGLTDFCDSIFGIRLVEETQDSSVLGWNKNVRVFHLYDEDSDSQLGTIYFDPFRDPYFRSQEASGVVMSRLFSIRQSQTGVPVAIIGLSIDPTWDDAPTPLSWKDFQDLLYEFGKAMQLILTQKSKMDNQTPFFVQSADVSEFLATVSSIVYCDRVKGHFANFSPPLPKQTKFMTLWIYNDGFLHRIAQLSQDEFTFQPELMKVLRADVKKQKALDLMEVIFLSTLELKVFTDFDPRGDETFVSLQNRVAEECIPHNVPDSNDLSPLAQIFRGKSVDPSMTGCSPLWSEILSSMVYEKFMNTDLQDRDAVNKLGRGIRSLFLTRETSGKESLEELCEKELSPDSMKKVHDF